MKTLTLFSLCLISLSVFAQKEEVVLKKIEFNKSNEEAVQATGLSVSTDDIKELQNLDWDLMLSAFKPNESEQEIKISVEYKEKDSVPDAVGSKAISFSVSGKSHEINELKEKLKKLTQRIITNRFCFLFQFPLRF